MGKIVPICDPMAEPERLRVGAGRIEHMRSAAMSTTQRLGFLTALIMVALLVLPESARASYTDTVLGTPGLLSYYRLGESSGSTALDATGQLNGTYLGRMTLGVRGALSEDNNTAAYFDGMNGVVDLGTGAYSFSGTQPFSLEAWVRRGNGNAATSYRRIISRETSDGARAGYLLFIAPDKTPVPQRIGFERRDAMGNADQVIGATATETGNWYHVVATYDGSTMSLYVNGQLEGSASATRSIPGVNTPVRLGGFPCCGYYNGTLDEVAFYNAALSAGQVQAHYSARVPFLYGIDANVAYYFNHGGDYWTYLQTLSAYGIKAIREDFNPSRGAPGPSQNYNPDPFWQAAAQNGIMIVPIMDADGPIPTGAAAQTVADVTAAYAARYGPGGTFWQDYPDLDASVATRAIDIWNEPYWGPFHGGMYNATAYAQLVRVVYNTAKPANPDVEYLLEGNHAGWGTSGSDVHWNWTHDLYVAVPDLSNYYDAVSVHPYTGASNAGGDPANCIADSTHLSCFQHLRTLRQQLNAESGGAAKRFWITENGWSTCPSGIAYGCVTEAQQATYTQRAFAEIDARFPYVDSYFLYHWKTYPRSDTDREGYFGIVRPDDTPKPAYFTYQSEIQRDR